jgi:hypothetical protein
MRVSVVGGFTDGQSRRRILLIALRVQLMSHVEGRTLLPSTYSTVLEYLSTPVLEYSTDYSEFIL